MKSVNYAILCVLTVFHIANANELTPDLNELPPLDTRDMLAVVPQVNEVSLKETFGHDLLNLPLPLHNFLLAISLDKVTPNSLTFYEPVGIPFIVDKGDKYWIEQYAAGNRELATLINLAIVFSVSYKPYFADSPELDLDTMQHNLLAELEHRGYWPAAYLLAEQSLLLPEADNVIINAYKERMIACSEVNFIPCQIRVGLAIANSNKDNIELDILKRAVSLYFQDSRYNLQDREAMIIALSILSDTEKNPNDSPEQINAYRMTLEEFTTPD